MPVWAWQFTDGKRAGPDTVIEPRYPGQPDAELLEVKRLSALRYGFTVAEHTPGRSLHLVKLYDPQRQGISRKDRWLEIRG